MTSEGISSQCDCEDANSVNGAWNCLLLLAWHSISSSWVYVLGFAVGATHRRCSLHLTTQSHLYPPALPPSLHSLREYNQPCQERHHHLLSGLIVSDWLCKVSLRPSPRLCNPTELARCQVILPHPSPSHPLTSPTFASHWARSDGKT